MVAHEPTRVRWVGIVSQSSPDCPPGRAQEPYSEIEICGRLDRGLDRRHRVIHPIFPNQRPFRTNVPNQRPLTGGWARVVEVGRSAEDRTEGFCRLSG